MKKKIVIGIVVVVVIAIIAVLGGNNKKQDGPLTFGMIAGMSGDYAAVGEAFSKGVDVAQEEWNSKHPDQQIKVIKEDDGFEAVKGLSAYRKLTSIDHIDGLINMTTITIDALYDEVSKTDMPIALGFEQGIEAQDDNVVQLWPGSVPAEAELGKYIKEKGYKNVVIFVDNESAAFQRFANGFKDGYGSSVQEITIAADGSDLRGSALKASTFNPDAIVFIVKPTSGALLVKELKALSNEQKNKFVFDANMQTGITDYQKVLGDLNVLNGSIVYTVPNIYRTEFTKAYKAKFGTEPTIGSETGYNAFMLLAQTYDDNNKKWISNMQKVSFDGADGKIVFDENGVRIPELKIGTIEGGKLPN